MERMMGPLANSLAMLLSRRLDWLGQRQSVLADNVANADTPAFRPRDIVPFEQALAATSRAVPLARTAAAHLPAAAAAEPGGPGTMRIRPYETTPAGNGVVIEEQLHKLGATQLDHQLATGIYGKQVAMLKLVLQGPPA
jgi:flagellar basal-body rod protein FlgB